jgi:hypothetical protein
MPALTLDIEKVVRLKKAVLQICPVGQPHKCGFLTATRRNLSGVLLYLNDLAALIETALGTDAMLHPRLLTIWTGDCLRRPQRIVRPPLTAARF